MTQNTIKFSDKFLPDQREHSYHYQGNTFPQSLYEVICHASGIESPHNEFLLDYTEKFTVEEMASNPVGLKFLQFIIKVSGVKRVLEIGAFIGVSAMYFAQALPEDGEVVTIEKFDHFAAIARKNFEKNQLSQKIKLIEGDAFEIISGLPIEDKFDMVFIDGNKERYLEYMKATEPLLSAKGIMIVDDVFFHGDALNSKPVTEKGEGVKAVLDYSAGLHDWIRIALPLANGILMMVRK